VEGRRPSVADEPAGPRVGVAPWVAPPRRRRRRRGARDPGGARGRGPAAARAEGVHPAARGAAGGVGARVQWALRHQPVRRRRPGPRPARRRRGVPRRGVPVVLRHVPAGAGREGHLHVPRGESLLQHGVPVPRHGERRVQGGQGAQAPRRRVQDFGRGDGRLGVQRRRRWRWRADLLHHRHRRRLMGGRTDGRIRIRLLWSSDTKQNKNIQLEEPAAAVT
jgi:hypothetical protein